MNGMKVHWIETNSYQKYLYSLFLNFNKKLYLIIIFKLIQFVSILNKLSYYNIILNLKNLNIFKFLTLSDFTAAHYPGFKEEFEISYFVISYTSNYKCTLKFYSHKEDLILSLNDVYLNSNWLEREVWDLFGLKFIYHQDLRRILTDYGFVGHPLLKYFPLTGFMELRFDDSSDKIVKESIEMTQAYRFFLYKNPWS